MQTNKHKKSLQSKKLRLEGYTRSESARQHSFFYLAGYMISYLLHRLFVDTYTVDMNGAAITITYYNEAPLTKVKPQNKKHANIIAERRRSFFMVIFYDYIF